MADKPSVFESIVSRISEVSEKAKRAILDYAAKDASGKLSSDAAADVQAAMRDAGLTPKEYKALTELHAKRAKLKEQAAGLAAAEKKHIDSVATRQAFLEEARKVELSNYAKLCAMENASGHLLEPVTSIKKALCELSEIEEAHAEAFGITQPDDFYDGLHLLCGSGDSIGVSDPDAPSLHVGLTVFRREQHRRNEIFHAFLKAKKDEWDQAFKIYHASQPRNDLGDIIPRKKFPEFENPTWKEIIEARQSGALDAVTDELKGVATRAKNKLASVLG